MRTRSQARIENNIHKATVSRPSSKHTTSTRASKRGSARNNNMSLDLTTHTKPLLQTVPANLAYVSVPSCVIGKPRSHSATALHAATHDISDHHLHAPLATLDASASHLFSTLTDVIAGGLAILGGIVVWTAASETVKRFCA